MVIKVMIVDDDPGMRLLLAKVITRTHGFEICAEAEDGENALRLFHEFHPDLVFVDVEMPGMNGTALAQAIIAADPATSIVFATAHGEYMPDAFAVYAADYLIKPFNVDRIQQTLERIRGRSRERGENPVRQMIRREKGLEKLMIRNKEAVNLVDQEAIVLIQREERSTVIYTAAQRYVTSESLGELQERLDKMQFFRSHKSYIINLAKIEKICPYGRWTYVVKLRDIQSDALLTFERYEELQRIFGQSGNT